MMCVLAIGVVQSVLRLKMFWTVESICYGGSIFLENVIYDKFSVNIPLHYLLQWFYALSSVEYIYVTFTKTSIPNCIKIKPSQKWFTNYHNLLKRPFN